MTVAAVGLLLALVDHSACPTGTGKLACKHSILPQHATSCVITVIPQEYKLQMHLCIICIAFAAWTYKKVSNVDNRAGDYKST